eukprot:3630943-Rhodomonas_salina.2
MSCRACPSIARPNVARPDLNVAHPNVAVLPVITVHVPGSSSATLSAMLTYSCYSNDPGWRASGPPTATPGPEYRDRSVALASAKCRWPILLPSVATCFC